MKLNISFYPDVKESDLESGTISEIDWQKLKPFFEKAFCMRDNEMLVGITVTESGIRARIEYIY